jgi:UDP-glucose 6-dehydrogenase
MTTKISFANMIGEVLILSGLENEIDQVLSSIASDTRIGKYLKYGFGFGGALSYPEIIELLVSMQKILD